MILHIVRALRRMTVNSSFDIVVAAVALLKVFEKIIKLLNKSDTSLKFHIFLSFRIHDELTDFAFEIKTFFISFTFHFFCFVSEHFGNGARFHFSRSRFLVCRGEERVWAPPIFSRSRFLVCRGEERVGAPLTLVLEATDKSFGNGVHFYFLTRSRLFFNILHFTLNSYEV